MSNETNQWEGETCDGCLCFGKDVCVDNTGDIRASGPCCVYFVPSLACRQTRALERIADLLTQGKPFLVSREDGSYPTDAEIDGYEYCVDCIIPLDLCPLHDVEFVGDVGILKCKRFDDGSKDDE